MRFIVPLAAAVLPLALACESHSAASVTVANNAKSSSSTKTTLEKVTTSASSSKSTKKTSTKTSAASIVANTAAAKSTVKTTSAKSTSATAKSTSKASAAASSAAAAVTSAASGSSSSDTDSDSGTGGTSIASLSGGSGVGGTTCTVTDFADVSASVAACSNILLSGVTVPASTTLSVTVPSGGALLFAGTMTVEYTPDSDYTPIVLKGSNAKVAGLAGAVIDGLGAKYWDGEGSNGGTDKPDHLIKLSDMEDSTFSDITIQNWPTHLFEITGCTGVEMYNLILDNSAGDALDSSGDALGHNTDAFDVSSTDTLYVHDATVMNQDDCVAVNSGSNMVFENLYCSGGHGLSIGSIDSGVTVSNVTFKDSSVVNSENGCRIKTDADGSDSTVSDITYSNIYVSGITDYAIDVQQDYENGSPTGDPTTGITVSGVTFSDITGSVSDDSAYQYYILCGSDSSCEDFTWSGIDISGGTTACSPSGSLCPSS
ncbi:glycosyl hydrolases family 28-domain-containing protein [Xylariales sp. PMI_506]|nr:glycosyl hydrolases family 28-domain-containing protein [Xylariales sp. PMI_506]